VLSLHTPSHAMLCLRKLLLFREALLYFACSDKKRKKRLLGSEIFQPNGGRPSKHWIAFDAFLIIHCSAKV